MKIFFNLHNCLGIIEKIILLNRFHSTQPQLFILGLPRTGTTVLYQYLVHRLKVAYFTNGVGKFPLTPCLVTFLQHRLHGEYKSDFKSDYGKVVGPVAPREAGAFWGRFFDLENYVRYDEMNLRKVNTLQNTIACMQNIFHDKPFVNKNVKHMLRIDALSKIFPKSYYLIVERELKDVALSLLRGRYISSKDPGKWLSVKPPNYEDLKDLPIPEQIIKQLVSLQKRMELDLSDLPRERVIRIKYESFCKEPESLISEIGKIFSSLEYKNPPVASFAQSINQAQNPEEEELVKLVKKHEKL
jgi:hypothetical protein